MNLLELEFIIPLTGTIVYLYQISSYCEFNSFQRQLMNRPVN